MSSLTWTVPLSSPWIFLCFPFLVTQTDRLGTLSQIKSFQTWYWGPGSWTFHSCMWRIKVFISTDILTMMWTWSEYSLDCYAICPQHIIQSVRFLVGHLQVQWSDWIVLQILVVFVRYLSKGMKLYQILCETCKQCVVPITLFYTLSKLTPLCYDHTDSNRVRGPNVSGSYISSWKTVLITR